MPKPSKTCFRIGGEIQFISLPCGKQIKGSVQESNKRFERHMRYCDKCPKNVSVPTLDKGVSLYNKKNHTMVYQLVEANSLLPCCQTAKKG